LAVKVNNHQNCAHGKGVPNRAIHLRYAPGFRGTNGYGRLIGHDFDYVLTFSDPITWLDEPPHNFAFRYALSNVRQFELKIRHGYQGSKYRENLASPPSECRAGKTSRLGSAGRKLI
jgi:hypothetical protein